MGGAWQLSLSVGWHGVSGNADYALLSSPTPRSTTGRFYIRATYGECCAIWHAYLARICRISRYYRFPPLSVQRRIARSSVDFSVYRTNVLVRDSIPLVPSKSHGGGSSKHDTRAILAPPIASVEVKQALHSSLCSSSSARECFMF